MTEYASQKISLFNQVLQAMLYTEPEDQGLALSGREHTCYIFSFVHNLIMKK